jgi:hypothetical protein
MKGKVQPTGFWTFFCNPAKWPLDEYLPKWRTGHRSHYFITSWQKDWFSIGDVGFIRVGHDQRSLFELNGKNRLERGVYALIEVTDLPKNDLDFRENKSGIKPYYVRIKYLRNYIKKPILLTELVMDPTIKTDPYLLKGHQASTMPLKEEVFNRILLYGEDRK